MDRKGNWMTEHVTFTEAVLLRPEMYTMGGTFEEVIAFLEDYYSGVAKSSATWEWPPLVEWAEFREWLREKYAVSGTEVFAKFREINGEEGNPVERMREALAEFRQEAGKRSRLKSLEKKP